MKGRHTTKKGVGPLKGERMKKIAIGFLCFVILLVIVGAIGFSYFNKRLVQSQKLRESGYTTTVGTGEEGEKNFLQPSEDTTKTMGAVEASLTLSVISPSSGAFVTSPSITVRGKTVAQAEVFVNEKELVADTQGNFSVGLILEEGENPILIVVNDDNGNAAEAEITVIYESEQ